MKDWLYEHKWYLVIGVFAAIAIVFYVYFFNGNSKQTDKKDDVVNMLQSNTEDKKKQNPQQTERMMVDVKGQVKHPGVYQSSPGERVIDVVTRAGGLTANANEAGVNFAEHVQDEMVINIPAKGEEGQAVTTSAAGNTEHAAGTSAGVNNKESLKININKADASELQNLPGIGPSKAEAIIEYREKSGPFKAAEDLKNITGIGDKTFEKLKDMVVVH